MKANLLRRLPHEVLLHVLKCYLDLQDLWTLARVSKNIHSMAMDTIRKRWGIELKQPSYIPNSNLLLKTQANVAMIALNAFSHKFIRRIKIYDPYAFPPFLTIPSHHFENYALLFHADSNIYDLAISNRVNSRQSATEQETTASATFPPTIEPDLDEASNDLGFIIERFSYHSRRLHSLLHLEHKLHQRILQGLSEYMNGCKLDYPLRTTIDILFHHAVFVSSRDRLTNCEKLGTHHGFTRVLAAAMSRLLCEFQARVIHSAEMIGEALWDNIDMCLTFTDYRLGAMVKLYPYDIPVNYHNELRKRPSEGQPLLYLLYTISALFDVLGACYVAYHIKDEHAILAIKRLCILLEKAKLTVIKKSMLKDLVDVWLNVGVYMTHSSLRSLIQDELK